MSKKSNIIGKHPRLYFTAEDLDELKKKRDIDPFAQAVWGRVLQKAELALKQPLPKWSYQWEFDSGSAGQKNLGNIIDQVKADTVGLAYLLEGRKEYADKARDAVLSLCNFDFWTSPRFFRTPRYDPPWRATLETADICRTVAWCYDWLYDYLSESERERIRFCLAYKGILPIIQDWADPTTRLLVATHIFPNNNWWCNCISGAGAAALALLGENDQAPKWIRLAKEAIDSFWTFAGGYVPQLEKELSWVPEGTYCPASFDSEGGYWEGMDYLGMLANIFHFSEPYLRVMGEEMLPLGLMKKVSNFILYNSYREDGRMRSVNFDDTRENDFTPPVITSFLARKLRHSGMQWYFTLSQNNFQEPSETRYEEKPPFSFLWYDPSLKPEEPQNPKPVKVFPGVGWAVMRTGWGREDTTFILKCGPTTGHAHADAGTFVLNCKEESLVIDSGVSSYEVPEYGNYYQASRAHNVVLVGKKGQGKKLPGKIKEYLGVPGCALVVADATAPYEGALKQFIRRALLIRVSIMYWQMR